MAIEKMALVSIEGALKKVRRTMMKCCESECFHIIPYTHSSENYYSSQNFKTLKDRNLFTPIVKRALNLAEGLGIKLEYCDYDDIEYNVSVDFARYLREIEDEYSELYLKREAVQTSFQQHNQALYQLEQLAGLSSNFEEIFAMKYIRVRFGRLPADSYPKLKYFDDKPFCFFPFETQGEYIWGVYFVPNAESVIVDDIFKSLFYERIRVPDYFTGTADNAKTYILKTIQKETEELNTLNAQIEQLKIRVNDKFVKVYCKLKVMNDSYELRTNVSVINNRFFLNGYIPKKQAESFKELIEDVETVTVQVMPQDSDPMTQPPVRLKNNWLFRPFEMFVTMYGLPEYGKIDPTPFVAVTYMLIYGIMFGDLGQGLFISLLGYILTKWKNVKLGPIMTRIGISSAFFGGAVFGSVFGNEEIIPPLFKAKSVYSMLGMSRAPEDIFQVSAYLLISAMGIGVMLIIITMVLNIITCLKTRDLKTGLFGASGITGLVLYSSVVFAAVMQLGLGISVLSLPYIIFLIIVPVLLLFFKEPISELTHLAERKSRGNKINKNTALLHAIKTYSDAISKVDSVNSESYSLEQLIECKYIKNQYGSLSYESYEKLNLFYERKFFFFPFESNEETVTGIYLAPETDFPSVDKLFSSLGFIKMKTPAHIDDIKNENKKRSPDTAENESKKEKISVGNFIIEGVIDLFETGLTYITNSMSFLRIGGFILSHAGLMLVVNILAEKAGNAGSIGWLAVQIFGNLFVIGMEGFLVGIQVLRLEFYEMFSRFYEGKGKPFKPIVMDLKLDN